MPDARSRSADNLAGLDPPPTTAPRGTVPGHGRRRRPGATPERRRTPRFRDLRAGLSARFGSRRAEPVEEVEPVDTSLEDLFATTATQEDPYFTADGLAHRLESVVSRARR